LSKDKMLLVCKDDDYDWIDKWLDDDNMTMKQEDSWLDGWIMSE